MSVRSLKKGIYYVGAIDWDKRNIYPYITLVPLTGTGACSISSSHYPMEQHTIPILFSAERKPR